VCHANRSTCPQSTSFTDGDSGETTAAARSATDHPSAHTRNPRLEGPSLEPDSSLENLTLGIRTLTTDDPIDDALWKFPVLELGNGYEVNEEPGVDEQGNGPDGWCSQSCTAHWYRTCGTKVVDGEVVKDLDNCTAWELQGTDCGNWVCVGGSGPGTKPPKGGGGMSRGPTNPPGPGVVPPMTPPQSCEVCFEDYKNNIRNAENMRDQCNKAADKEATRRCKKMGLNVPDCRSFVKNRFPFGLEFGGGRVSVTELLPSGHGLSKICGEAFNRDTIAAGTAQDKGRMRAQCQEGQ
jgi:hypothetical protein